MSKIISELILSGNKKLVFSIENFRGIDYDSVRVWTNTLTFKGPTLSGFILAKEKNAKLINIINKVTKKDIEQTKKNKLLDKITLSNSKSLQVSLQYFKNKPKLDIREYVSSGKFEGYTRRGVSIYPENFQSFIQELNKLFLSVPEKQQEKLFEDIDIRISEDKPEDSVPSTSESIPEIGEVIAETIKIPKKKDIKKESIFSRLFEYYWYIQKSKTGFSDLTDVAKAIDYYDLSEYLGTEKFFNGEKEEIQFKQPEPKKTKDKDEISLDEEVFEKVKKIFLSYQDNSYEREFLFGFPYIFFHNKEDDKLVSAPLFVVPCKLEYDTSNNTIKLTLLKDDFELNIAVISEFLEDEGKEYIREELIKNKPHLPLDENQYKEFLTLFNNLLGLKVKRELLPSSFELDATLYKEHLKEDKVVKIINKSFLLLTRKSSFYILNDLEKLISLGDEVANSILAKFFDPEDTGAHGDDESPEEDFKFKEYLFPFPSNQDQRRIVDALAKDLILVQGPPGTGKSQTISNLICHLVANGKTVLVSSQKNKALEVIDEKLKKKGLNYLQMTLLKNDTEAKKELIDKINDLDYYIGRKTSWEYKERIQDSRKEYLEIDEEIARLAKLFEDTKEATKINEGIFRQYSQVKHFNLIEDDVPFLAPKNTKQFRDALAGLIDLLKQVLPYETSIQKFILATKCSPKNIHRVIYLLKSLLSIREKRKEHLKKAEFNTLRNLLPENEQRGIPYLLEKTNELFALSQKYDGLLKQIGTNFLKVYKEILKEATLQDIEEQENKLVAVKDNLETVRRCREFADLVISDDPTEVAAILGLVRDIKKSKGFLRKIMELWGLLKKFQYRGSISKKVFKNFHKSHILDDLENACLYRESEIAINRACRGFYFAKLVKKYLDKPQLQAQELATKLTNGLDFIKTTKMLTILLNSYFHFKVVELEKIISKFNNLEKFAIALNNYYRYENLVLGEKSTAMELKPLLKDKFKDVEKLIEEKDNIEISYIKSLLEVVNYTNDFFKVVKLERELNKFSKTIDVLKTSIKRNTKLIKEFELNIDNIFACEMLDNQIKETERKYPLTTQKITEKITKLKDDKFEAIVEIIQNCIDSNLLDNYSYSTTTQREIAHFRRQIRRSKKSYKTFEEMKEVFDFEALLKVFPCWVMSIEDIARVFPLKAGLFDYIIIDEASQCSLPPSVPTLFRGKKAIVVGDDNQLSDFTKEWIPTTLNESLIKDLRLRAFRKFDSLDAKVNSLFDSCSVFRETPILLTEHFRSYPEIINFSNHKFYRDKLRIMTNSLNNKLGEILNIISVDGTIENEELKINEKEALAVINFLKKLMSNPKYNELKFGILSLFREQANFIRKLMYDDDFIRERIEKHELIADTVDGFQGDERDVILYSFRYAPNSTPSIFNFTRGEDGWRRVNVAFTRARKQVFCFISQPIEKFPSGGSVKEFLQYTQSPASMEIKKGQFGSDFEKDVYELLKQDKGITVIPQFETCGFFIDFVLLKNGKTLALECDGMQHYTDTGELIEADIERQDILERADWQIKRLSSREFYRDTGKAIDTLLSYFE